MEVFSNNFSRDGGKKIVRKKHEIYRFDAAARSVSCFFLTAKEVLFASAAAKISSARHSGRVLIFRKVALRTPFAIIYNALFTRRIGETSTACKRTTPALPTRQESSRGPELQMALTRIWIGFSPPLCPC